MYSFIKDTYKSASYSSCKQATVALLTVIHSNYLYARACACATVYPIWFLVAVNFQTCIDVDILIAVFKAKFQNK